MVHRAVQGEYTLTPAQSVGKLSAFYRAAASRPVALTTEGDNLIYRIRVENIDETLMACKHNSGFFFEYEAKSLNEILPICDERCQTLTYFGLSRQQMLDFYEKRRPRGVDRMVPVGKSMDFSLIWDGFDLIEKMSRRYTVV